MCHSSPLAACTVSTCTRSRRHLDLARCEPVLGALGGVEVVEQEGSVADGLAAAEVGNHVREGVEVRPPDGPGTGGGLRVEQEKTLGVGDQVRQGHRRPRPEAAQLAGEPADPREALRRVAAGLSRVVQGVDQAGLPGVLPGQRAECQLRGARRCGVGGRPRSQLTGARPERRKVRHAQPPPRTGEEPHRRRSGQRIRDEAQGTDQVAHLGGVGRSAQAHHLHGQVTGPQRRRDRVHVGPAAHEDRRRGRRLAEVHRGAPPRCDGVGHPVELRGDVRHQGDPDVALGVPGPAASSPTATAPGAARSGADAAFASTSTSAGCGSW